MNYSNRRWVQGADGKWSSRPVDRDTEQRREAMLERFTIDPQTGEPLISSEEYRERLKALEVSE